MPGQSGVGGRTAEFIRKRQERRGQGGASPSPAGGQPPAPGGKGQSLGVQRRLCAFFRRLMVHLGAIFASAGITGVLGIGDEATGGAMMLLYLGFINLIPPGSPREHTFYVPAGVGLAQALAALILGVPLPVAVFLGGAQSFLQRGILHKGALGFGWSALPFLLAGLYAAISGLGSLGALAVPLGVFLAFSLGGALFQHFYVRRQAEAFLRRKLQQILSDLERYSIEQRLTARLREALLRLKGLVGEYLPSADLSSG
ncbi:MAG: hypothetical protein K6A65_07795, partial [Succinivibrionaceae bacterium]|nr:hypothetical protein [Succinivibrionaceae bacterium]